MSKVYIISWEYLREELCENSVVFVQVYFVEEVSNGVEALEISLLNCQKKPSYSSVDTRKVLSFFELDVFYLDACLFSFSKKQGIFSQMDT